MKAIAIVKKTEQEVNDNPVNPNRSNYCAISFEFASVSYVLSRNDTMFWPFFTKMPFTIFLRANL